MQTQAAGVFFGEGQQPCPDTASLGGGQGWPTTFFIDRRGRETFVHEGAYPSEALLDQDIRRYALGA